VILRNLVTTFLIVLILVPLLSNVSNATEMKTIAVKLRESIIITGDENNETLGQFQEQETFFAKELDENFILLQWNKEYYQISKKQVEVLPDSTNLENYHRFESKKVIGTIFAKEDLYIIDSLENKKRLAIIPKGQSYDVIGVLDTVFIVVVGNRIGYVENNFLNFVSSINDKELIDLKENYDNLIEIDSPKLDEKTEVKNYDQTDGAEDTYNSNEVNREIEQGTITYSFTNEEDQLSKHKIKDYLVTFEKDSSSNFTSEIKYFEVIEEELAVYDNRGKRLKQVGTLEKGQVYPRVQDYGNWHKIQFGDFYGYVKKSSTRPAKGNEIKNENKGYTNSSEYIITDKDTVVYDNTTGELAPYAVIDKGQKYPIVSDYGNWYRILVSDRVGYIRKNEVTRTFTASTKYFEVIEEELAVYDNRGKRLKQVGTLEKGQIYPRVQDYGNWHKIQFGDFYGYVKKSSTRPAKGNEIKNENKGYTNSDFYITTFKDTPIYDNSSGKLIQFGSISRNLKYPIISDYGNWYRILVSDRVGYVRKADVIVSFTKEHKYFEVLNDELIIYDNSSGSLKPVGSLYKGAKLKREKDYGNWHQIQFGNKVAFVKKSGTRPLTDLEIKGVKFNEVNEFKGSITLQNDSEIIINNKILSNSIGIIRKGISYPIIGESENWYKVNIAGVEGFIDKYIADTSFFMVKVESTPIYDNSGKILEQVGTLLKGQVYPRVRDYGSWHRIKFGNGFGYVRKSDTEIVNVSELGSLNRIKNNNNQSIVPLEEVTVYDKTTGVLVPFATLRDKKEYPIIRIMNNWAEVDISGRIGYVRLKEVVVTEPIKNKLLELANYYKYRKDNTIVQNVTPFYYGPSGSDYINSANDMLKGKYRISPYGTFNFGEKVNWVYNPSNTRSYYRSLHSQFFIYDLIKAYETTKDPKYIRKGFEIIEDWIEKNPYQSPSHEMAWHDETTGRRIVTWVSFFDQARHVLDEQELAYLIKNMINHAEILLTDSFYKANTNHGMFQDEGLLVFSEYFKELDRSKVYSYIAKKRLKEYFDYIISSDGVHKEHSPGYGQIIAESIQKYKDYYKVINDRSFGQYLSNLYYDMSLYSTFVIKPDGKLPYIGDTFTRDLPFRSLWKDKDYYQFALTKGEKGKPLTYSDTVFPDGGYAVFRDSWDSKEKGVYIHFTAAYHTYYHKHSDDLSIWIYSNGDIISEAGANGYDYDNPYTEYGYSSFAHNTLIVDNKGLPRVDEKFDSTRIIDFELDNSSPRVRAINERYEDVTHIRDLQYFKSENKIVVKDIINSGGHHNYKILWHLSPGVSPEFTDEGIYLIKNNERVAKLSVETSSQSEIVINHVYGQKKPYLLGWYFDGVNNPLPSHTLLIETDDQSTEVISVFELLNQ